MGSPERKNNTTNRAYAATRSVLNVLSGKNTSKSRTSRRKLKLAFIHNEKRVHIGPHTGAAQINKLMAGALKERGVIVQDFHPKTELVDAPVHLKGVANILFFYSLLEHKNKILKNDIIQGTTYTPLPFLTFNTPTVCHFGSTAQGFLTATPRTSQLPEEALAIFKEFERLGIIPELDFKTLRPTQDVADIEKIAATHAAVCVATSEKVRTELMDMGVPKERITVIHNAIEDYWFSPPRTEEIGDPHLVFLGRLGGDVFTLKLKGLSRLVRLYRAFPDVPKTTVCMTTNRKLKDWLKVSFPNHFMYVNLRKDLIPGALAPLYGSILFLSSRYEGFSLSLIEGMSQGLVPVAFRVGVAPEVIENGKNGFLVSSMEEAIARTQELLDNKKKRFVMAERAKKTASRFKSVRIAKDLETLYRRIDSERRTQVASEQRKKSA